MSDILFSHSYYYKLDAKQWKNRTPFPPLGTLYAAALMRENGYNVNLFDTNLLEHPYAIESSLETLKPKYLVIYDDGFNYLTKMCLTVMREACFQMIALGKEHDCTVIVCSSDATDHYPEYLRKGADYVIQGEGEMTLLALVDTLEKNESVEALMGIAFKKESQIQSNPKRPVLQNLDELPLPAWDLVDMNSYKIIWAGSNKPFTLNMATTRGCPYKCNWCAKPIYGNRYNSHSPEYIASHIEFLRQSYGVRRFWMCDDIFGLKPNWVQEFNRELRERRLNIRYYIQSRVDLLLKEDTIDALAASGLEEVWVGAESASQKILDAMDKGTKVDQIYHATRLLKKKNIRVAFFLQFGYLDENQEDILKTIGMVKELMPDNIGISISYPLPGTPFYEKVKSDMMLKSNWTDSDDFEMMFKGTYNSGYYRKLQRFVHKEYRKSQGFGTLKQLAKNPFALSFSKVFSVLKLGYYVPSAFADQLNLKRLAQMATDTQNISTGFSSVYEEYEALSREDFIDADRRNIIRRQVESRLKPHHKILEINAGSGIDALYFAQKGFEVLATDIASGSEIHIKNKIAVSGLKNLRFQNRDFTALEMDEKFDHIFSNFGGLNCVEDISIVLRQFDSLLNPNGFVTLVIMPKIYPWEMLSFFKGNKNAFRRFRKNGVLANVGNTEIMTFYHSPNEVKNAIGENFSHIETSNIGTFYPSSHFKSMMKYRFIISVLVRFDRWINSLWLMPKGIGDYFMVTFQKIKA